MPLTRFLTAVVLASATPSFAGAQIIDTRGDRRHIIADLVLDDVHIYNFGQTFRTPSSTDTILEMYTFWVSGFETRSTQVFQTLISEWDPVSQRLVGPFLDTRFPHRYLGTDFGLDSITSSPHLVLDPSRTYMALLSVIGAEDFVEGPVLPIFEEDTYAGGEAWANMGTAYADLQVGGWTPITGSTREGGFWPTNDLSFTAEFTHAVPEPSTYGALAAGVLTLAALARRPLRRSGRTKCAG